MVGVPGRSKACHTCKKRKKKCDLQRPICGNCTRGNLVCAGYDREMILIQVDPTGKGTYQQPPPRAVVQYSKPALRGPSLADVRYREFNRTAFELECFAGFRQLLTPEATSNGWNAIISKEPSYISNWWGQVFQEAPQNDLVRCSFLAISAYHVGHANRDLSLRNRGVELYSKSLCLLRHALGPSQLAKRHSTMSDVEMAGYTLCLYEFFRQELPDIEEQGSPAARFRKYYDHDEIRFSSRSRGPGHIVGMINLVHLQNPVEFAQPIRHEVFVQLRQIWIPLCIERRTSTFLGTQDWLTKPWQGLRKSYYDILWDALALMPAMLEEWEALKMAPPGLDTGERASMLKLQFCKLETKFEEWRNDLSIAGPSFSQEAFTQGEADVLRRQVETTAPEDLPDIFAEHGLWYLLAWTLYWAACIPLYCTVPFIYLRFPPTASEKVVAAPVSIGTYCLSVARSVKYFFQPGHTGMLTEMGIRMSVFFVQKALSDPVLRATGDPKILEAENILKSIGRTELQLAMSRPVRNMLA